MCFYSDSEWYAQVNEEGSVIAEKPTKCDECRILVAAGQLLHVVHQEEYDECQTCENGECECGESGCCACDTPNHGETFDWQCCEDCWLFLQVVEEAELASGCRWSESRPPLGGMVEAIQEHGSEEAKKYFDCARSPHHNFSPVYLDRLWECMFGD